MAKKATNIVKGNAKAGAQVGNNIRDNGDGTYTVNGKSVGSPRVSGCGCPGADTYHFEKGARTCTRCGRRF